jgi:hypothetical protein
MHGATIKIWSKHFVFNTFFYIKQFLLWDNLEKCGTARGVTRCNVMLRRKDAIFMPDNEGNM